MQDPATTYLDATVTLSPSSPLCRCAPRGRYDRRIGCRRRTAGVRCRQARSGAVPGFGTRSCGAEVGEQVDVGPFATLRPGTVLGGAPRPAVSSRSRRQRSGPTPRCRTSPTSAIRRLARNSNIGAGRSPAISTEYRKHRTVIGDRVFIGSDTMLVAPVTIGDDAFTGAGSVITQDVSPGSLAVERSPQKELPGYAERRARSADTEGE